MIAHAGLSNIFWAEAISAAAYVRNRLPTTALKERETPYERWYGRIPDVSHFRVFGCMAYAHVPDCERRKLDAESKKMRFVGYSLTSKDDIVFLIRRTATSISGEMLSLKRAISDSQS